MPDSAENRSCTDMSKLEGERKGNASLKDMYHRRVRMLESALQEERLRNDPDAKPLESALDKSADPNKGKSSRRSGLEPDESELDTLKLRQEALQNHAGRDKSKAFLEKCLAEVTYLVSSHPSISLNKPAVMPLSETSAQQTDYSNQNQIDEQQSGQQPNEIAIVNVPRRSLSPVLPEDIAIANSDHGKLRNPSMSDIGESESVPLDEIALEDHEQIEKVSHVFDANGKFLDHDAQVKPSSNHPDDRITPADQTALTDVAWDFDEAEMMETNPDSPDSRGYFMVKSLLRGQMSSVAAIRIISARSELWIASCGVEATIKVHKHPDEAPTITLRGHTGTVTCLCVEQVSPTALNLLTGGDDMVIRKWPLRLDETNTFIDPVEPDLTFISHSQPVTSLALVNRALVSTSLDRSVRLWDMHTGASKASWWSPDDDENVYPTAICACHATEFAVGYTDGRIKLFNTSETDFTFTYPDTSDDLPQSRINSMSYWTKEGSSPQLITAHFDSTIRFFGAHDGQFLRSISAHKASITCLTLVDSTRLVSASHDNSVRVWDIESGDCVQEIKRHQSKDCEGVLSIDYKDTNGHNPDKQAGCLVSAGADGTIAVYMKNVG